MAERFSEDNMPWSYRFDEASLDQSQSASATGPDQIPWLYGVDGRFSGGLRTFPGHKYYGSLLEPDGTGVVRFNSQPNNGDTLTIDGLTITFVTAAPAGNQVQIGANRNVTAGNLNTFLTAQTGYSSVTNGQVAGTTTYGYAWTTFKKLVDDDPAVTAHAFSTVSGGRLTLLPSGGTLTRFQYQDPANRECSFTHYAEILETGTTYYRGYVMRIGGSVFFAYKRGDGTNAFDGLHFITDGVTDYKLGVTYFNRMIYIVGSDGTNSFAKVVYYHPRYLKMVTADFGPGPTTVGPNSHGTPTVVTKDAASHLDLGEYGLLPRYYDSTRFRYSTIPVNIETASAVYAAGAATQMDITWQMIDSFSPLANEFDYVAIYSTISSGLTEFNTARPSAGFYFRRNLSPLTGSSTAHWIYSLGDGSITFPTLEDGLPDEGLVLQEAYDPVADFVNTTVPAMEGIQYYQGSNFALVNTDGYIDIRWTPADRIEPENLPILNTRRTRIRANGVAHFRVAGDYLWVFGDGESYRIQKVGSALSIHRMLDGYHFVSPYSTTALGTTIIGVTTTGIILINANTGETSMLRVAEKVILDRWVNNLEAVKSSGIEARAKIYTAIDHKLGCVYIYCRPAGEVLQLWPSQNRATMLVDCHWNWITTGYLPNTRTGPMRAIITTEDAGGPGLPTEGVPATIISPSFSPEFNALLYPASELTELSSMSGVEPNTQTEAIKSITTITYSAPLTEIKVSTFTLHLTAEGRLAGAVFYVLTGAQAGRKYKIVQSVDDGNDLYLYIVGDIRTIDGLALAAADKIAIAPVVTAAALWPLYSNKYAGDYRTRRVVEGMSVMFGQGDYTTVDYPLLQYGLCRQVHIGDVDALAATLTDIGADDPENNPATTLPWTNHWSTTVGEGQTLNLSTPGDGGTLDAGLYAHLLADGGLLYPTFQINLPGANFEILDVMVTGRAEPTEQVNSAI